MKVTVSAEDDKSSTESSNFLKDSQNSLSSGKREMDKGETNMFFGDRDGQRIPRTFSKLADGDGMFGRHTEEASH